MYKSKKKGEEKMNARRISKGLCFMAVVVAIFLLVAPRVKAEPILAGEEGEYQLITASPVESAANRDR